VLTLSIHDYEMVVEQAPIMIWRANTDGRGDYFNGRWLTFTGRTMDQDVGDGTSLVGVEPDALERHSGEAQEVLVVVPELAH